MTTTLKLDPTTGDLDLATGKGVLLDGNAQLAQRITTALRLYRGEHRYDLADGFPWLEQVFNRKTPPRALESMIRDYVKAIPGVTAVNSVTVARDNRLRKATISIRVNGQVEVQL